MRGYMISLFLLAGAIGLAQDKTSPGHDDSAALTIYNQSFAVVRQTLPLELKSGTNQVEITDITAHLEPDSVILRDLKSGRDLRILEQNYRSDVASQGRLLALYEGKTIEFLVSDKDGNRKLMPGKIIRSGYTPHYQAYSAYDQQYYQAQQAYVAAGNGEPIIEIEGKLQFGLPGQAELQFTLDLNDGLAIAGGHVSLLRLVILLIVCAVSLVVRRVSAADNFSRHELAIAIFIAHQELNGLAFIQGQQTALRRDVTAVVLLQNAQIAAAFQVAQDDRIGLQMRRDVSDFNLVCAAFEFQRQRLPHHGKRLVIDGESGGVVVARRGFVLRS